MHTLHWPAARHHRPASPWPQCTSAYQYGFVSRGRVRDMCLDAVCTDMCRSTRRFRMLQALPVVCIGVHARACAQYMPSMDSDPRRLGASLINWAGDADGLITDGAHCSSDRTCSHAYARVCTLAHHSSGPHFLMFPPIRRQLCSPPIGCQRHYTVHNCPRTSAVQSPGPFSNDWADSTVELPPSYRRRRHHHDAALCSLPMLTRLNDELGPSP